MPRQTRATISKSALINAYGAARNAKVPDGLRLGVFIATVIAAVKEKPTLVEKLKALKEADWKTKVNQVRAYLEENTVKIDGKIKFVYSQTKSVTEKVPVLGKDNQPELDESGNPRMQEVTKQIQNWYLDRECKTPLPENHTTLKYPTLWIRQKSAKDNSDLIAAIDSLEAAVAAPAVTE